MQTAGASGNVVLDVATMETLHTEATCRGPVQSAFGAANGRYGLVMHLEESFVLALDRETTRTVQRIEVGGPQAKASFTDGGATAYITVPSRNEVVAIAMNELTVVARIGVGEEPMGLVLLAATSL